MTRLLLVTLLGGALVGCGGEVVRPPPGIAPAKLERAQSCADLEAKLKRDALDKLNARIDQQLAWSKQWGFYGFATPGQAVPDTTAGGEEAASEFSKTTTQVPGVDEADIVKTDGAYLYLLHGQRFTVIDAWPPEELALETELTIEGFPYEMFVADGRAAVFSTVDGGPIYQAAGVVPRPAYQDYGYYAQGGAEPAGGPGVEAITGDDTPAYAPLTKITIVDADPSAPTVEGELYFEGFYSSSRRVDDIVRAVLTGAAPGPVLLGYPDLPNGYPSSEQEYVDAWEKLRREDAGRIAASTLRDWLPYWFVKDGAGVAQRTARCEDFYVPAAGTTEHGLTQIVSLDWRDPSSARGTSVIGRTDIVYASPESLYLAAHAYDDAYLYDAALRLDGDPELVPLTRTHLHRFDTRQAEPLYVASGTVTGSLLNQFSLDEHQGFLRAATTEERVWIDGGAGPVGSLPSTVPARVSHVFVLEAQGDTLAQVGTTGPIAPNERIFSTRFVGEWGYVVTFRQIDPLFVIDLQSPFVPKVVGELEIPGFSEYMHPLDDDHLLTIGRETEQVNGTVQIVGLALKIFDVSDRTNPMLAHAFVYDDPYGGSAASYDHKAFAYFPERGLLGFPYVSYAAGSGLTSTLEVFSIDIGAGIAKLGSIDHSAFFATHQGGYCGGYYGVEVRRGLFLEDFVYSISYGGVVASDVNDLGAAPETLPLPSPQGPDTICQDGGPVTP